MRTVHACPPAVSVLTVELGLVQLPPEPQTRGQGARDRGPRRRRHTPCCQRGHAWGRQCRPGTTCLSLGPAQSPQAHAKQARRRLRPPKLRQKLPGAAILVLRLRGQRAPHRKQRRPRRTRRRPSKVSPPLVTLHSACRTLCPGSGGASKDGQTSGGVNQHGKARWGLAFERIKPRSCCPTSQTLGSTPAHADLRSTHERCAVPAAAWGHTCLPHMAHSPAAGGRSAEGEGLAPSRGKQRRPGLSITGRSRSSPCLRTRWQQHGLQGYTRPPLE